MSCACRTSFPAPCPYGGIAGVALSPLRALILASCLGCGGIVSAVESDGPRVSEVVIEGVDRIHPDRVRARLGTRAQQPLDRSTLADDVRAIHSMRAFTGIRSDVQALPDGTVRVVFSVQELPYVGSVEFSGIGYFLTRSLRRDLRTRRGSHLDPLTLQRDRQRLRETLRQRNYLHAEVTSSTRVDSETGIATVIFHVDTGHRVRVARVQFEGLPSGVMPFFIQQNLANRSRSPFDEDMLTWDAGAVAQYLSDQGYLDAQVTDVRHEFFDSVESWEDRFRHGPNWVPEGKKNDRVVITYFVDPGPRFYLKQVSFLHDPEIASESELREAFTMRDGDPMRRRDLDRAVELARRVIANKGYARARVEQDRVVDEDSYEVDLTLRFEEGRPYRIGRIDPDGNRVTRDAVIRRAMAITPGELYNEDAMDRSRRQIMRAGVFRNEPPRPLSIDPIFDPERPEEVDLRVRVNEDDTGRFVFNIGWSSASGLIGQASYEERNFDFWGALIERRHWRGGAQTLNANVSWSEDRTVVGARFTNPRVFDSNYFLSLNFQRADNTILAWDERKVDVSSRIGRYFLDFDLLFSAEYGYSDLKIDRPRSDAPQDVLDLASPSAGNFHINSVSFRQSYDVRNNPSLPTSGFRASLEQTIAGDWGLSASHPHLELSGTFTGYIPLLESDLGGVTFLEFRQRVNYLQPLGSDNYVPFYARYFGGGPAPRHRGYQARYQGPRRENDEGRLARFGGTREWLSTLELSVPLQGTNRGIRAVAFTDVGQIWDDFDEDDQRWLTDLTVPFSDFSVAVGGGIRMPAFLPIALDLAYVLNPETGQSSRQFHFSIFGGF